MPYILEIIFNELKAYSFFMLYMLISFNLVAVFFSGESFLTYTVRKTPYKQAKIL